MKKITDCFGISPVYVNPDNITTVFYMPKGDGTLPEKEYTVINLIDRSHLRVDSPLAEVVRMLEE